MENSTDGHGKSSRTNSIKDELHSGLASSTKSLDKSSTSNISNKSEKNSIQFKTEHDSDIHGSKGHHADGSTKVPHKIISNWKHACDKTKDKTKDLLKRWRTLPEIETTAIKEAIKNEEPQKVESGWSVHVWTTWVDRFSIDSEILEKNASCNLTPMQSNKFSHFFTNILDHDHDDLISEQDFETLIQRFRHFADWSVNSSEFNTLREVERGFIETFLHDIPNEKLGFTINNQSYLTKEGWLQKWSELVNGSKNLNDFPVWLQVLAKVLFQVMNRNGNGIVTKEELGAFYSSVLCLSTYEVEKILDISYKAMTSNGDHPLMFKAYRLCFANYLLGRFPNGPGQHILGAPPSDMSVTLFPVDYSALNAQPEDLEQYSPDQKSNRRSVIV